MLMIKLVIFQVCDTNEMLMYHGDVLRKLVIRLGCWSYSVNVGNMAEICAKPPRGYGQKLGFGSDIRVRD